MNKLFQKIFNVQIGKSYRFCDDYGGKFGDGSNRNPLRYIPTEIKLGRVFYNVVSPDLGFICGDSSSLLSFILCYRSYE